MSLNFFSIIRPLSWFSTWAPQPVDEKIKFDIWNSELYKFSRLETSYNWFNVSRHEARHEDYIRQTFARLDGMIDIDFVEVNKGLTRRYSSTDIEIYRAYQSDHDIWSASKNSSTGGGLQGNYSNGNVYIFWRDIYSGDRFYDSEKETITHEIGHALGLSHPSDEKYAGGPYDGYHPDWDDSDSVMSYNRSNNPAQFFTDLDIQALREIWGGEDDIPQGTDFGLTKPVVGDICNLGEIKDFGGTEHGGFEGSNLYKFQGQYDINDDGSSEWIFTNEMSGRWATIGPDESGLVDYKEHGTNGSTRIVGIYDDPLVLNGEVEKGSPHDSQIRFQNDLFNDNLRLGSAADVDNDGFGEVFWKTTDGSAFLRSIHHLDGNVKYANYMNAGQMTDYLSQHGYMGDVGASLGL